MEVFIVVKSDTEDRYATEIAGVFDTEGSAKSYVKYLYDTTSYDADIWIEEHEVGE